MITKVSNNDNAESGLLPYPVIIARPGSYGDCRQAL